MSTTAIMKCVGPFHFQEIEVFSSSALSFMDIHKCTVSFLQDGGQQPQQVVHSFWACKERRIFVVDSEE